MTGDQDDIVSRLQRWLPTGWFPTEQGTRIWAVLKGFGSLFATIYQGISYAQLQTRIATATDGFLELISADFFGGSFLRLNGEQDGQFSLRIRKEILRDKLTRTAIDSLLFDITGAHPTITELERPADIGGYGNRFAWGAAGMWGSRSDRKAVFITCRHAGQFGVPLLNGWGGYAGGWGQGRWAWAGPDMIQGTGYSDAQIMAALERIRAAGVTYWVHITNETPAETPLLVLGTETGAELVTESGEAILL